MTSPRKCAKISRLLLLSSSGTASTVPGIDEVAPAWQSGLQSLPEEGSSGAQTFMKQASPLMEAGGQVSI